ncbi:MAG: hypothetical protein JXR96_10200 [Deltaproteobacteria bacterium]|nr:hypothetical protein [Deltaproteobacteria bacterium]
MRIRLGVCSFPLVLALSLGGPGCMFGGDNDQADGSVVPGDAQCEDLCVAGETRCVTGGFQECGDFDGDDCTEWSQVTACEPGEVCSDGVCRPACEDECSQGSVRCNDEGTATQECMVDSMGCWIWGVEVDCLAGETCSEGVCRAICVDECEPGSRQCHGNGYQVCVWSGTDSCKEWGSTTQCPVGETCSDGYCSTGCTNECTSGSVRCSGIAGFQVCGDHDSDACLDWGPTIPCPAGEMCSNGECDVSCADECEARNDTQCTTSGGGYQVCDYYGASPCLIWGPSISCAENEVCLEGRCVLVCDCDFYRGICEPEEPSSTTACSCDSDCTSGTPCVTDGHCDSWCPPNSDPDCDCLCDYNEYCEADTPGGTDTCPCDRDCESNEVACADDGHCDTWCPAGADPDCGADACRDRWMRVGFRQADQSWLSGSFLDPDPAEGSPWVQLSPGLQPGSAEVWVEFAAEHLDCVRSLRIQVWGYDESVVGDGAEFYIFNWQTYKFDLLPDETVRSPEGFYTNGVQDLAPYLLCGSGVQAKCYVDAKLGASAWDDTHLRDVRIEVYMSAP